MRIAIVAPAVTDLGVPGVTEVRGGGERYPSALAVALAKSGANVDLVTFGRERMELRHHSGLGIRVIHPWSWRGDFRDPVNPALLRLASQYDVIHAHLINKAAVLLALGSSLHRTKVVLTPLGGGARAGIRRGLWKLFDGSLLFRNTLGCVNQNSRSYLRTSFTEELMRCVPITGNRRAIIEAGFFSWAG